MIKKFFRKSKKELIILGILYLIFDIYILGAVYVSSLAHESSIFFNQTIMKAEEWTSLLGKPLDIIGGFFRADGRIDVFFRWSGITLLIFLIAYIVYKVKNMKTGEYDGIENGSSDWAQNGEEFDKTENGKEILNRKSGFILSKDHYLGTDLKKVLINKNILVVGRFWCW